MEKQALANLLEAAIMAYNAPLSIEKMQELFDEEDRPTVNDLKAALAHLAEACAERGVVLIEVASGYRFQSKQEYAPWLVRLWEEKPQRYTRATLETLVLIAYRQPITRAEIEEIRGVSVSSHIVKSLLEREWIRLVGHKDVPGKPSLYGTTKKFLDYFNLASLKDLPTLEEVQDLEFLGQQLQEELTLDFEGPAANTGPTAPPEDHDGEEKAEQTFAVVDEVFVEEQEEPLAINPIIPEDAQTIVAIEEVILIDDPEDDVVIDDTEQESKKSWLDILNRLGQPSANEVSVDVFEDATEE